MRGEPKGVHRNPAVAFCLPGPLHWRMNANGRHSKTRVYCRLCFRFQALQEVFSSIRQIRSCINVSGLCLERVVLRAIMGISAHAISLADRPRPGHSGHQCSHAPGRPISIASHPLADLGGQTDYVIGGSSFLRCSFVRAWRPFLRPDLARAGAPRARGGQGWPSGGPCLSLPCCQATP